MSAGSKMDPPLANAESISNSGRACGITYLRREKSLHNTISSQKREVRICERNNSADAKVSEEGGGEGAPRARTEIHLQPVVKTTVRQAAPLQPMEVNGGADTHLQPMEDCVRAGGCPKGGCDPVGRPCWSRLLAEPVDLWREEPTLEQGKSMRSFKI
ncbi:protein pxr1-like [Limosa lapponica baueri]|uniref:Protein pxr1-like n=1 Tax=Limosa lapponica baueri TaxID=1758121 RepID=A0A2I0UKV2_LIMLA|nr:protein pxr1-like [Limosa lapponica baueri]